MIHYVSGDLLLSSSEVIAHGVAPNDHFEQGLALALRERWPAMVKDFRHWCHLHNPKPGTLWSWGGAEGARIVNLLTQEGAPDSNRHHPGKAKREYINHALKAFKKLIEEEGFTSVALPRLATGVGGMDWSEVKPLIEQHLGDAGIPIHVYHEFRPGVTAVEKVTKASA